VNVAKGGEGDILSYLLWENGARTENWYRKGISSLAMRYGGKSQLGSRRKKVSYYAIFKANFKKQESKGGGSGQQKKKKKRKGDFHFTS